MSANVRNKMLIILQCFSNTSIVSNAPTSLLINWVCLTPESFISKIETREIYFILGHT